MKYFAINQNSCIFVYQIKQKTKQYENNKQKTKQYENNKQNS